MKAIGQGSGYGTGTNASGFSALLVGVRPSDGTFGSNGTFTGFWCPEILNSSSRAVVLIDYASYIEPSYYPNSWGFSVRCINDSLISAVHVNLEVAPPSKYELSNAYPNPWNPTTTIRYQVPINILVTIKIFDALGKEVTTLVNEVKPAGSYEVTLNGKNLASGVYYYQMKAGTFLETKKFILIK